MPKGSRLLLYELPGHADLAYFALLLALRQPEIIVAPPEHSLVCEELPPELDLENHKRKIK